MIRRALADGRPQPSPPCRVPSRHRPRDIGQLLRRTTTGLLAVALVAACSPSPAPEAASPVPTTPAAADATLFEDVRIFDGTSKGLSAPSNVLVVGDRIKKISRQPIEAPPDATVIAGGRRTLMPGLIDAHVHLYLNNDPKVLLDPSTPAEALEATALSNGQDALMAGFTTVRDMAGPVFEAKEAIDRGDAVGPRIYPSGAIVSQTAGHGDFAAPTDLPQSLGGQLSVAQERRLSLIADGRDQVLAATRYNLRNNASQIKIAAGGGVASEFDPVTVSEYTFDEIRAAVQAAADYGTYVAAHVYTSRAVRRCIKAGVKVIEHGQLMDEETLELVRDKDVWLSTQVFEELPDSFSPLQREKNHEVVVNQSKVWRWAVKDGVKVAWGTDFMFGAPRYGPDQNQALVKMAKWMTPAAALKVATHDNAQLLAMSGSRNPYPGQLGVVTPGAYADLLLVDGDPTKNLEVIADPAENFRVIMKNGIIYKDTL